ncbi:hypothetical protein [Streptomyces cylindrosporus]|uniref:Uncharacterized protein n=1 Tax=Streptomyces cylindrosporus TaxID=2927583 RepID=A0ABS9YPD2_9ACTN|nr:hypothetical protein [Streptomyces cylindrosporus]MCI3279133.1 hypothetical protein [Streptomyces cylindrosporus]
MMDTNSAFAAYGIHIPVKASAWQATEGLDEQLAQLPDCPDVSYMAGGDDTQEQLFLVTYREYVPPGTHVRADATPEHRAVWDAQLARAVSALGFGDLDGLQEPAWLWITEVS